MAWSMRWWCGESLAVDCLDIIPISPCARGQPIRLVNDLVVNATPLGMNDGDPLPIDMNLLSSTTFVGEVVMKSA